jgi:uncharacterized protein (TIGR03435 family)
MAGTLASSLGCKTKCSWAAMSMGVLVGLAFWGFADVPRVCAQRTGDVLPSFEVASIKLDESPEPLMGFHICGDRFNATGPAIALIGAAYNVYSNHISGGPDWIKSEVFDIDAKVDDSLVDGPWKKLSLDQQMHQAILMLRSLLADRFKLQITYQTKEFPVYALVLAKNGPKFTEDDTHLETNRLTLHHLGNIEAVSEDLSSFADLLSIMPELGGRRVLDKTGLQDHYSFAFHWTPEKLAASASQSPNGTSSPESSGPSLFTALQEELGLKLQSAKAPLDTIVIEHIEQPSEN